jgi:hypothetical protein
MYINMSFYDIKASGELLSGGLIFVWIKKFSGNWYCKHPWQRCLCSATSLDTERDCPVQRCLWQKIRQEEVQQGLGRLRAASRFEDSAR